MSLLRVDMDERENSLLVLRHQKVFLRRMVIPSRREHLCTPIKRHKLEGEFTGQFDADERNVRDEQGLF